MVWKSYGMYSAESSTGGRDVNSLTYETQWNGAVLVFPLVFLDIIKELVKNAREVCSVLFLLSSLNCVP